MSVISMINSFQDYAGNHPVEKIYLHLDKPYYASGEYMYFRAYLTDQDLNRENAKSGIIYVELSDAKKNLVKRVLLYSENHEFAGQIQLPDSLPSANYHLRAYTNYMRNAGEDYFYHRDIYIGNPTVPKQDVKPAKAFDYQVSFFPEGGQLLSGLSCKVAFKSLGNDGFGTDITGVLSDSDGKEILRFSSQHLGMGSFNFTPEKGKTYKATVQSNGMQKEYTLPTATEGLTLSARQDDKSVFLTIHSTNDKPDSIYIIGQSRNAVCYALNGYIENHEQKIRIDKTKFPMGIAQFTLFKDGKPVSERLLFIDRKDDFHVSIVPDKEEYSDREKANVRIQVSDKDGEPVEGDFSLSVTDDRTVKTSINEQNIKGSLLLAEDLKGYIESPGWYFSGDDPERAEALDNLLCTQGWTRFVWDKSSLSQTSNIYPVESEFQITGKVTNLIGKPVKGASIFLINKGMVPIRTSTDEEGEFGFYGFNCPDTAVFIMQCLTENKQEKFTGIQTDKSGSFYTQSNTLSPSKSNIIGIETVKGAYMEQINHQMSYNKTQKTKPYAVKIKKQKSTTSQSIGVHSVRYGGNVLNKAKSIQNLLEALPPPIPIPKKIVPRFIGMTTKSDSVILPAPFYTVDGGRRMFQNIFEVYYGMLRSDLFESVEILSPKDAINLYGTEFSGGAYILNIKSFTKDYKASDASIQVVAPEGYCVRKEFYVPTYDKLEVKQSPTPDFRTTIYWNPVIQTDQNGRAEVSFFTADNTGTYSYILEGIGDNKVGFAKK